MYHLFLSFALLSCACETDYPDANPLTYGDGYMAVQLATDKAAYAPGETVRFTLNAPIDGSVTVRYRHLGETIAEEPLTALAWSWTPPAEDFRGYLADLYAMEADREVVYGSIAVDVSSDPCVFPRNGFLSSYRKMPQKDIDKVIANLNRHHINYVQYQDWHYKHHMPLAGTPQSPMSEWTDIVNRATSLATVRGYIDAAHSYGMKSLFYNLAYGALNDADADGVQEEWYLYKDANHAEKDHHPLGSPFKSSIFLTNPANGAWIDYLAARNDDVYAVFDFDGYQIDQLGGRGDVYDYSGQPVRLDETFNGFIDAMKRAQPSKRLVMNAVGQYGQGGIARAPVDFLYTEVWSYDYTELSRVITENDRLSDGRLKTVLAAYMNYGLSQSRGYFNTPGVLLTSAVIHAWGGAHLQLGEHMLCNEYFPNDNRSMDGDLQKAMIAYYDFITAYENLLRDGGEWVGADVISMDGKALFNPWGPQRGSVATVGKDFADRRVVHLLNFTNAAHLEWVDRYGEQPEPLSIGQAEIAVAVPAGKRVAKVWMATPDADHGVARRLEFTQDGDRVALTLPSLKYWDMLVLEY